MTEPQETSVDSNDERVQSGVEPVVATTTTTTTRRAASGDELDLNRGPFESHARPSTAPLSVEVDKRSRHDFEAIPSQLPQPGGNTTGSRMSRRLNVTADAAAAPYDQSFHPGQSMILLYSRPRQRQRWGDAQILPRVNWGDLFFDLFYVGATYNVSDIVVGAPNPTGLLYAAGTFLPIMGIWAQKMLYDARYVTESDIYHRCMNMLRLLILGVAVVHIQPAEQLSNDWEYPAMFTFSLMMVLESILSILQYLELRLTGVGQPAMKVAAMRDVRGQSVSLVFYMAAMVVSAVHFFTLEENNENIDATHMGRVLAESSPKTDPETNHVPITLLLSGYLISLVAWTIKVIFCFPSGGRHKEISVPMNVDFLIHRQGEWTMLMLGESILSILIVDLGSGQDQEGNRFYSVFYCGVLTVIGLQFLHFQSQPLHADVHAARRNKNAGMVHHLLEHTYSLALVLLGACFTFFLTLSEDYIKSHRRMGAKLDGESTDWNDDAHSVAFFFGGALAAIFLSLDFRTINHLGFAECQNRCTETGPRSKNWKGILVILARIALIVFVAAMGSFETDPKTLSIYGASCVLAQMLLRKLGTMFLSSRHEDGHCGMKEKRDDAAMSSDASDNETGEAQWPNVTHARAELSSDAVLEEGMEENE